MRRSSKAGFLGAGLAALTLAPAAGARHSEPYCHWGSGVLPNSDVLRVTVERDRFMQDECDGTTVRVRRAGGGELVLVLRSEHDRPNAERREATRGDAQPTSAQQRKSKRCTQKKHRRGAGSRRCQGGQATR